ncbi:MarR family winged helix-turn-helix transcriptional regulator [Neotabrizicola sp. VNH66]|uniref:MarR family winged helix-turn-helix transcriptional regulator n=1 Tax=Neotabrizicola sp. VNH66 TaxID=3400918 RepID=UPI003BFBE19D
MEHRIERLGQLLHDASRGIRRRFEERTACHGLSATQWRLLALSFHEGPMTQAALADRLDVEPMSVSRLVDRMEAGGWVQRIPHPDDRRARLVRHTDKAAAVADSVRSIAHEVFDEALVRLNDDQRRQLQHALVTIIETLATAAPAPAAFAEP